MRDALFLAGVLTVTWAPGLAALVWLWLLSRRPRQAAGHLDQHCTQAAQHRQLLGGLVEAHHLRERQIEALFRAAKAHEEGRPWLN